MMFSTSFTPLHELDIEANVFHVYAPHVYAKNARQPFLKQNGLLFKETPTLQVLSNRSCLKAWLRLEQTLGIVLAS